MAMIGRVWGACCDGGVCFFDEEESLGLNVGKREGWLGGLGAVVTSGGASQHRTVQSQLAAGPSAAQEKSRKQHFDGDVIVADRMLTQTQDMT